jgi:hypothetical protein
LEIEINEDYFNVFHHHEKQTDIYGFDAGLIKGKISLSDEHVEFKWISKDEWQSFEFIPSVTETLKAFFK